MANKFTAALTGISQPRWGRDSPSRSRILISRASSPHNTVASTIPSATPAMRPEIPDHE